MNISTILREPLLHFFAGGTLLFLLYGFVNSEGLDSPDEIIVDDAGVTALAAAFERARQRPPTESELRGLVDNWIREEILYREGLAMRLDENDPIVRRRIAQKIEFIAEGLVVSRPDVADMQGWLDEHPDTYRIPASYTLRQFFFDPSKRGESLQADIENARAGLSSGTVAYAGDPTMLPESLEDLDAEVVGRIFGKVFATSLEHLSAATWVGPVESDFGQHLVYVEAVEPSRLPTLDEVRREVERDMLRAQTEQSNEAFYNSLREKYTINITANSLPAAPGT